MSYTHIVERASGYTAGWFTADQVASGYVAQFIADCNANVPADPAALVELDPDGTAWDGLLAEVDRAKCAQGGHWFTAQRATCAKGCGEVKPAGHDDPFAGLPNADDRDGAL